MSGHSSSSSSSNLLPAADSLVNNPFPKQVRFDTTISTPFTFSSASPYNASDNPSCILHSFDMHASQYRRLIRQQNHMVHEQSVIETFDPNTGRLLSKETQVKEQVASSRREDEDEKRMLMHAKQTIGDKINAYLQQSVQETQTVSEKIDSHCRDKAFMMNRCADFYIYWTQKLYHGPAHHLMSHTCDQWNQESNVAGIVWSAHDRRDDEDMDLGDIIDLSSLLSYRLLITQGQSDEKTGDYPLLLKVIRVFADTKLAKPYKLRAKDQESRMVEGLFLFGKGPKRILILHEIILRIYPPYATVIQAERLRNLKATHRDISQEMQVYEEGQA